MNGRSLDVRVRVPASYERMEMAARQSVSKSFGRGSVSLTLTVETDRNTEDLQVNRAMVDRLLELHGELSGRVAPDPPKLESLLLVKGVIETNDAADKPDDAAERDAAMLATLQETLDALAASRQQEGERLDSILAAHLTTLERLNVEARESDGARIEVIRDKLMKQIAELMETPSAVSEERLAQEVALLATKADVREEIDRLDAHCAAGRELLAETGPVGRKLDFLCQELNREANTLCSKASTEELTRIGLEFKAVIDQFREQAQNVE